MDQGSGPKSDLQGEWRSPFPPTCNEIPYFYCTQVAGNLLGGTLKEAKEKAKVGEDRIWCARILDITHLIPNIYACMGIVRVVIEGLDNV